MRGYGITAKMFYDSILAELTESQEIEGLVFHLEESGGMKLKAGAKIERRDYGLPWPAPKSNVDIVVVN